MASQHSHFSRPRKAAQLPVFVGRVLGLPGEQWSPGRFRRARLRNAHLQDVCVCVSLPFTLATHLNNSLSAAITTARLPSPLCFIPSPGHRHSLVPTSAASKGAVQGSTAAVHPMLPLLPTAAGSRRCFSPFPADTQYLVWVFFLRGSCAPVTTCLVFPSSALNILNSLRQGKDLLLHRAGFLFSGWVDP